MLDRDLVAVDARHGGQRIERLRLEERVLWTGARGAIGMVLTDQRVLGVATGSAAWQSENRLRDEQFPAHGLLGERIGLVVTSRRALAFDGGSGNLLQISLGLRERVIDARTGENVAIVVTDRRALGASPFTGGFFTSKLELEERFQALSTGANLATLTTDRRVLIFRGPSGTFEERNRTLR